MTSSQSFASGLLVFVFGVTVNLPVNAGEEQTGALLAGDTKNQALSDPDAVARGRARFSALCAYCHGKGGSGGKARKLQGRQLDSQYVFKVITNGKKRGSLNMPPWRKLPEETRWDLTAYVLSLGVVGN